MENKDIERLVPALLDMSRLKGFSSEGKEDNSNVAQSEKLINGISRVLELFEKLDEVENLPDEYLVHPTSNSLRYEVFSPENNSQSELLSLVPKANGPFIQSPLVIDDES